MLVFFFSSRRRHTRFDCDWSSDVCSSDLVHMLYGIKAAAQRALAADGYAVRVLISYGTAWFAWYMRRLAERPANLDRKSTRLNSSHSQISYAVFCLKKKKQSLRSSAS